MMRLRAALRSTRSDEGMALVLVIGAAVVMFMMSLVVAGVVSNSMRSSTDHQRFEGGIALAEAGVDDVLSQLQNDTTYTAGFTDAAPLATWNAMTSTDRATAESAWARQKGNTLAAGGGLKKSTSGEYVAFRPANLNVVYAVAYTPTYAAAVKTRVLKAEYIFAPYAPADALLTQGTLTFSGSVSVAPSSTAVAANVHTNGSVSGGGGSLNVAGVITSSGSFAVSAGYPGSGGGAPQKTVPIIMARYVYDVKSPDYSGTVSAGVYDGSWYDLCPLGLVKARDQSGATPVPCTGTVLRDVAATGVPFRGWSWALTGGLNTWTMNDAAADTSGDGSIYYIFQGNAVVDGKVAKGPFWNASVIAEATSTAPCSMVDGSISWKHTNVNGALPGVVYLADNLLDGNANNDAKNGLFGAGNQIRLSTSSATLTGYLIASDRCPSTTAPTEIQGVSISYDGTGEAPVKSVIRTTLWLEL